MYEVSVEEFERCVSAEGCKVEDVKVASGGYFDYRFHHETKRARGRVPMNGVSWYGARDYCAWIGARLPTEAEWEYVACGGKRQLRYPWSPEMPPTCKHAVFGGGVAKKCGYTSTREVNTRLPFGEHPVFYVVHLAGNVWEWVADWYGPDYYVRSPLKNPPGPEKGTAKVQRGGGWNDDDPTVFRTTYRAQMSPELQLADVGFRCATESIH
jgi:formylglycine-generating enzyme required for sulfatase activity